LTWLSSTDFGKQQTDNLRKWQPGTVQWLLDSREYQKWVQEKGQIIFCPGIPGAGKTVSASVVVNDLTQRFSSDTNIGLVCLYCSYTQKDSQHTVNLLGGILKQLCQSRATIPQTIRDLYTNHQNGQTGVQYDGIMKTLKSYLADYSNVMVVVDALDEWQPPQNDRFNLVDELLYIHSECHINLFVTSRFVPAIQEKFQKHPCRQIIASHDDIHRYIEDYQWPLLSPVRSRLDLQQEIKSCVCQAANGM
jgi:Cdc6-like AAA superfamily ATPase